MSTDTIHVALPFGPAYPALPALNEFRKRNATHGSDPFWVDAYGQAVHREIRALQRAELRAAGINRSERTCNCASGTNHNDGHAILKSVKAQNRAAAGRVDIPRGKKEFALWDAAQHVKYASAMHEKNSRNS